MPIKLIVGLGNPGNEYEKTRHNAGRWLVDRLLEENQASFSKSPKFKALTARVRLGNQVCDVLFPTTYMNLSGQAVAAFSHYYHIPAESILVVHDELDLPAGTVKLKVGGGNGGHNGLKSISQLLGSQKFMRMRIGIGHPGASNLVTGYVLNKPSMDDKIEIDRAIDRAIQVLPDVLSDNLSQAMQELHTS